MQSRVPHFVVFVSCTILLGRSRGVAESLLAAPAALAVALTPAWPALCAGFHRVITGVTATAHPSWRLCDRMHVVTHTVACIACWWYWRRSGSDSGILAARAVYLLTAARYGCWAVLSLAFSPRVTRRSMPRACTL